MNSFKALPRRVRTLTFLFVFPLALQERPANTVGTHVVQLANGIQFRSESYGQDQPNQVRVAE